MSKDQCYLGTPNGVVLCVDHVKAGQFGGRMYHAYAQVPKEFKNLEEMLFEQEELYDFLNFPYPATNDRTFSDGTQRRDIVQERTRIMSDKDLLSKHGDLGTFIIRVQHRRNSSWQGRVTWTEKDKTVYFRSVWELIKLIAGALDTVSEPEEGQEEISWPDEEKGKE